MPSGQTSLQFVTVGNPGNVADTTVMNDGTTGYGSVPYTYKMGTYDVTVGQYTAFLNAVAQTDTYGLFWGGMGTAAFSTFGIQQNGSSGNYSYSVIGSYSQGVNCPVFSVSWGDAARFCNWRQNGQPTGAEGPGTTETGAYTLNGATSNTALMAITRNANATYFIPSENEWYKAVYFDPTLNGGAGGYWAYPTKSNTAPSNVLSATGTNNANWYNGGYTDPRNSLTPVGYFAGSPGPYGTFDMGGDVWQWNEANIGGEFRVLRGGSFYYVYSNSLASSSRYDVIPPAYESFAIGFRVASTSALTWNTPGGGTWDTVGANRPWLGVSSGSAAAFTTGVGVSFNLGGANPITVDAGGVQPFSMTFGSAAGSYTFSGGSIGGLTGLSMSGGTVTLNNANTYSGGTSVNGGQLNINNGGFGGTNSSIGTGALTISGGSIDNTNSGAVTLSTNNAQVWNADFTYLGSAHNLNVGTGVVILAGNRQVTVAANTLTVGGPIGDGGNGYGLTKAGGGTLVLAGSNTYSGATTIQGGLLVLQGGSQSTSLTAASGGTLQVAGGLLPKI
jgi:autotransporter-associated beta strand protein